MAFGRTADSQKEAEWRSLGPSAADHTLSSHVRWTGQRVFADR
jgi:hypothetical protein